MSAPSGPGSRVPIPPRRLRFDKRRAARRRGFAVFLGVLALNIDLAPTIADAAGVPHPPTDGRSLLTVLGGDLGSWRSDFLIERMEGTNPIPTFCAVRSERWTYVRYSTGEEELYDLAADPYELDNLAGMAASRSVLERQRARLRELCWPVPPGFGDRSGRSVPIGLAVLGGLVLVEALVSRRRRTVPAGSSIG